MIDDIEQLNKKRRKWVEASQENNFEEGIKELLTCLYPDNAHFIYELLQNAEDTGATEVSFTLYTERIEFRHNGKRLFSLEDVDGITGLGVSTKRDDPTSIGKFGVGFKAVFAYTNTPQIHSGKYHFSIHDLVVPETEGVEQIKIGEQETCFSFPFNHPKKSASKAVKEITDGLHALGDNVLLFLNHIRKIEYRLPDGKNGSLERIKHKNNQIEIHVFYPDLPEASSHWLRFVKKVGVQDEDGQLKKCFIAIAYRLNQVTTKGRVEWKIIPFNGQVSIYFPAEKENSNLRFHINAPFASTVARDSVRDCDGNKKLRDHLAELIVKSLSVIRDQNLLTVDFLAVMPNLKDDLLDFYKPIREAVVKAFQDEKLTPTKSKSHAAAKTLYRGPASISTVLDDEGLALFVQKSPPLWVANPQQQHQRDDDFLDSLKITHWDGKFLFQELNSGDSEKHKRFENWLGQKKDRWLKHLYDMLFEECIKQMHPYYLYPSNFCRLNIVRVDTEQGAKLVTPRSAYFLPDVEIDLPSDIYFVKKEVYNSGKSDKLEGSAYAFLNKIGVEPFDVEAAKEKAATEAQNEAEAQAAHELGLDRYLNPPIQFGEDHYEDIRRFINYWKEKPASAAHLFSIYGFLLGRKNDKFYWRKPTELFLDLPYLETHLDKLEKIHGKFILWDGYNEILGSSNLADFIDFLKDIGVKYKIDPLVVIHSERVCQKLLPTFRNTRENCYTRICEDYSIDRLQDYLDVNCEAISCLVWQVVITADAKVARARYSPNKKFEPKEIESHLVEVLKGKKWIPDRSGVFRYPQDMTRETLCDDFLYDESNGLLKAIGFGSNARIQGEENENRNRMARELGFDSAEEAMEASKHKKKPPFPVRPSKNPERRSNKMTEQHNHAPGKKYEQRQRSVRVTGNNDPVTWLINQYTNINDQLICQICQFEMPFRKRDGEYYFEAVEAFSKDYFSEESEELYLALCPECAARYKEFVKRDEDVMKSFKNDLMASEDLEVPLQLGELCTTVQFVEVHWQDIKTILQITN